jgi:DNA polymerase/3'-5' exonuclease PolX
MDNQTIAEHLLAHARYLDQQPTNLFRKRAYRRAAETVLRLDRSVNEILDEQGMAGLEELTGIGGHLAYTIESLVRTGEFRTLSEDDQPIEHERLLF